MFRLIFILILIPGIIVGAPRRLPNNDSLRTVPLGFSLQATFQNGYMPFNWTGPSMSKMFPEYDESRLGYDPFLGHDYARYNSYRGVTLSLMISPSLFHLNKLGKYSHLSFGFDVAGQPDVEQYYLRGYGISIIQVDTIYSGNTSTIHDSCMYYNAYINWKGQMKSISTEISIHSADEANRRFVFGAGLFCGYYWMQNSKAIIKVVQNLGSWNEKYYESTPIGSPDLTYVRFNSELSHQEYERPIRFRFLHLGVAPYVQWNFVIERGFIFSIFLKSFIGYNYYFNDYGMDVNSRFRISPTLGISFRPVVSI